MTEEDLKFNRGTSMWKGRMIKDMTKDELIDAFWEFGQLFEAERKQHQEDLLNDWNDY